MADDGLQRWVASGLGVTAIAMFALFLGGARFLTVELGIGHLLALVGTGVGAVGGVGLLVAASRGRAASGGRALFIGVQICMFAALATWNFETVDHAGFRGLVLVSGGGILCIGSALVVAALLGPDRVAWLDGTSLGPE